MIAIGCAITSPEKYEKYALPGIEKAVEPDTEMLAFASSGTLFRSYNLILDQAAKLDGLEALVLLHQDAEITDPEFLPKIRKALEDPEVGLVGCAGAVGVRGIAWWEGAVTWASFSHHYEELGGGEIPALTWLAHEIPTYAETGEVDMIDGFVMAFTPWAIENVRFDELTGGALHGYDFDICHQVRAGGRKVVTADLKVVHHHSIELITDLDSWVDAHVNFSKKWDHMLPDPGASESGGWEARARRAEAEASAARTMAGAGHLISESLQEDMNRIEENRHEVQAELRRVADELEELKSSTSWRITRPLRAIGGLFGRNGDRG